MTSATEQLIDLVSRKHDCLAQLHDLGLRQRALIEAGEMTSLLNVLAEKQRVLAELQQWERQLDPFRHDDPARRVWSSDAERLRCASLVRRSDGLLAEVLDCEKHCEETLRRRRDETAEQLASAQSAGMTRDAYASQRFDGPSTLDISADD